VEPRRPDDAAIPRIHGDQGSSGFQGLAEELLEHRFLVTPTSLSFGKIAKRQGPFAPRALPRFVLLRTPPPSSRRQPTSRVRL